MPVKGNQQAVQQADTEGDMSRDAGNPFQYFRIHTDVSLAHPSLADKAECTVGEDLGSNHLPITIELRCQTPVASDHQMRARWKTRDVNWQAFLDAVEESVRQI